MIVRRPKRNFNRYLKCLFCETKTVPDYKEPDKLKQFVSERGKIVPSSRTGVCAKHQRRLCREIKRARHLALLPFLTKV